MSHSSPSTMPDTVNRRNRSGNKFIKGDEILHSCILHHDLPRLRRLLARAVPADLHEDYKVGMPLQFAAWCGDLDSVNLLLDYGADPRFRGGEEYMTAITSAATEGHGRVVERLWRSCPPQNHVGGLWPHQTCLIAAAENGHLSIVASLLGLWDRWPTKIKEQALIKASERWQYPIVEYLLEKGGMLLPPGAPALQSALDLAANRRDLLLLQATSRGEAVNCTILPYILALLIDAGADPNTAASGTSILIQVVGDIELTDAVEILLDKGADPNAADRSGCSPLHYLTAKRGSKWRRPCTPQFHERAIRLLLGRGGSVLQLDHVGKSPLQWAAFSLSLPLFHTFMESIAPDYKEAILRAKSPQGETLLHFAAAGCNIEVMEFLISIGLDVNERNSNNWTPLMCALTPVESPNSKTRQWVVCSLKKVTQATYCLLDHGADPLVLTDEAWNPLHALSLHTGKDTKNGDAAQLAKDLISRGVDPRAPAPLLSPKVPGFVTTLDVPWGYRLGELMRRVQELVDRPGNEITRQTFIKPDMPPLFWAAERGAIGVVKALIEAGVDPTLPGSDGKYPAQVAADSIFKKVKFEPFDEIAKLLVDAGSGL